MLGKDFRHFSDTGVTDVQDSLSVYFYTVAITLQTDFRIGFLSGGLVDKHILVCCTPVNGKMIFVGNM
jgi:hypothetical protein